MPVELFTAISPNSTVQLLPVFICSNKSDLFLEDNFFESLMFDTKGACELYIYAATATGPAQGPLPASSIPTTMS